MVSLAPSSQKHSRTPIGFGQFDFTSSGSIRQAGRTKRALQVYSFLKQQIHAYFQAIGQPIAPETNETSLNQRQQALLVRQRVDATRHFARYLGTSIQQLHQSDASEQFNLQVPAQTIDHTYRLWLTYSQAQIAAGISPHDILSVQVKTNKYKCNLSPEGIQLAINTGMGFIPAVRVDKSGKGEITAGIRLQDLQAISQNAQRSTADWIGKYSQYLSQSFTVGLDQAICLYEQQKSSLATVSPDEIEALPLTDQAVLIKNEGQPIDQASQVLQASQPIANAVEQSIDPHAVVINLYPTPIVQQNLKAQLQYPHAPQLESLDGLIEPFESLSAVQPTPDVVINLYPTPVVTQTQPHPQSLKQPPQPFQLNQPNQSPSGVGSSSPPLNQPQLDSTVRASPQQPDPVEAATPPVPKGPEFWKQAGKWVARMPNPFRQAPEPASQQPSLVNHPDYPALSQGLESISSQYRAIFTHQDRSYSYRLGEYELYISSQAGGRQGMISIKQDGKVIAATDPYTLKLSQANFSSLNTPHLLSRLRQFEGFLMQEQKIVAQELQLSRVAQVANSLSDLNQVYRERFGNQAFEIAGRDFTVSFDPKGAISISRKGEQTPAVSIGARGEIASGGAFLSRTEVDRIKQSINTIAQNWQQLPVVNPQAQSKRSGR